MATIHLTLRDTPTGGVALGTDFHPAIGLPLTPAQAYALDILARTKKEWGGGTASTQAAAYAPAHNEGSEA